MASGWDPGTGKVVRNNSRNTGATIWDQDAQAAQVIDSIGHDFHDQGLADSISDTLHIGGYNSMQANLDMGGFKVVGMASGSADGDAVAIRQHYDDMGFNDQDRVLTISAPDGSSLTTVIPSGAGGGTVTSIDLGVGITGIADPITGVGSVELAPVAPDPTGDYQNGIGRVIVDAYGRVTTVEDNFGVGVNLGVTRDGTTVDITNTGGDDAQIPAATTSLAGVMTAADKTKLDSVVQNVNLATTTTTTNVTVTNTGGNNATIEEATSSRAGVMTAADHDKLSDMAIVNPGSSEFSTLRWNGTEWVATADLKVDPVAEQVTVNHNLVVNEDLVCDEIGCGGIRIADTFPNIEWDDTAESGTPNFSMSYGSSRLQILGTGTNTGSDPFFRFVKPSSSSPRVETFAALNGAVFSGPSVAQVVSYMTEAERLAMVDMLEAQGVLSNVRATHIKSEISVAVADMVAAGVTVQIP